MLIVYAAAAIYGGVSTAALTYPYMGLETLLLVPFGGSATVLAVAGMVYAMSERDPVIREQQRQSRESPRTQPLE